MVRCIKCHSILFGLDWEKLHKENLMYHDVDNSQDILDSRDIIERIQELENERDEYGVECVECDGFGNISGEECETCLGTGNIPDAEKWEQDNPEDATELNILQELEDEASGYSPDWRYGATLIRDDYFEDFAREEAEGLGMINKENRWPNNHIDWEAAADELKNDYTRIDFDGVDYWIR